MPSEVRVVVRDDDQVALSGFDGAGAPGANVRFSGVVWLDRDHSLGPQRVFHGHRMAHMTRATAIPMAPTTSAMSRRDVVCLRKGLKPMIRW